MDSESAAPRLAPGVTANSTGDETIVLLRPPAAQAAGPVHVGELLPAILVRLALKRAAYKAPQREREEVA